MLLANAVLTPKLPIPNSQPVWPTGHSELLSMYQPTTLEQLPFLCVSCSASTLLTIFGGRIDDIRSILIDERIPEGWESRIRTRLGLTFGAFNLTVGKVSGGVKVVPATVTAKGDEP